MSLLRLRVSGRDFTTEDGRPWRYRGMTFFRGIERILSGVGVPVDGLRFAQDLGVTVLRVFGSKAAWPNVPNQWQLIPGQGAYWQALDDLLVQAGLFDLRVVVCALCDAQVIMPDVGAQRAFIAELYERTAPHTNVLISLGNEFSKNGFDPSAFPVTHSDLLISRGSNQSDAPPPQPFGAFVEYHTKRGSDWWGRASDALFLDPWPGFPISPTVPSINDEPTGAAEQDRPGARDSNPEHHRIFHGQSAVAGLGSTLHGDSLIHCDVPIRGSRERACYEAGAKGWLVNA